MSLLNFKYCNLCAEGVSRYAAIAIIILASFAVYFNTLQGDFVYDDLEFVLKNRWIRDIRNIPTIFTSSIWSFQSESTDSPQNYYRPMMQIIYMANYHIFGLKPWGWHLTNIILHSSVTVIVFLVISELFNQFLLRTSKPALRSPAFIAALLFAVHPIHTEVVAWASVAEMGFTFFYLLAFYLYIKDYRLISLIPFFISTLFKETALTLPLLLFAYDYLLKREFDSRFTIYSIIKRYLPHMTVAIIYLALRTFALGGVAPLKGYANLTGYEYAINIFPLFAQYLEKLILPVRLNAYYVFHPIHSIIEWKGLVGIAITGAFIVSISLLKRVNRLSSFSLLFILVPLLPVFYIRGITGTVFAERYLYLPSVGFVTLISIVFMSTNQIKIVERMTMGWTLSGIVVTAITLYSAGTVARNDVWRNGYNLWTDTVRKSPDSSVAHYNLGISYDDKGMFDEAIKEYQMTVRLSPWHPRVHNNLGLIYLKRGQLNEAIKEFQTSLIIHPRYPIAHHNLGSLYVKQGRFDEAIKEYQTALRLRPDSADGHYNLGIAYKNKGLTDEARRAFEKALRLNPNDTEARQALESLK